jgi:hypothetical protein
MLSVKSINIFQIIKKRGEDKPGAFPSPWDHIQRKLTKLPENMQVTQRGSAS